MTPARPRVHLRFRRRFCGLMDGDKVAGGNVSRGDGDTRGLKRRRVYTQKTDVPVTPHPHPRPRAAACHFFQVPTKPLKIRASCQLVFESQPPGFKEVPKNVRKSRQRTAFVQQVLIQVIKCIFAT